MTKVCSKCRMDKDITQFSVKVASKDGRNPCCKECCKKSSQRYRAGGRVQKPRVLVIDVNKDPGYTKVIQALYEHGPTTQGALERRLRVRDGALCSKLITLTLTEDTLQCNGKEYVLAEDDHGLLCLVEKGGGDCISLSP